jgi:hypothetical protein
MFGYHDYDEVIWPKTFAWQTCSVKMTAKKIIWPKIICPTDMFHRQSCGKVIWPKTICLIRHNVWLPWLWWSNLAKNMCLTNIFDWHKSFGQKPFAQQTCLIDTYTTNSFGQKPFAWQSFGQITFPRQSCLVGLAVTKSINWPKTTGPTATTFGRQAYDEVIWAKSVRPTYTSLLGTSATKYLGRIQIGRQSSVCRPSVCRSKVFRANGVSPSNRMKAVFFLRLPQLEVAALEQHKDFINSRSHFDQGQRHETNLIYWPSKDVTRTSKRRRNKIEKRQRNVENVMAIRQKCPRNVKRNIEKRQWRH